MRELRHLKKIVGDPAEELARADVVIEGEGQGLDMGEDVPPHVRLDEGAQPVAPVADDILQDRPGEVGAHEADDEQHEGAHQSAVQGHGREKGAQDVLGHQGERHVHGGDHQRAGEVQHKQTDMGPIVGQESTQFFHI